ncbi:MAG TPA: CU044_5270 family protein [Streptosporangiaceae bacterium]|nr:CU044_5270 family protein [Streptosporangiaceae bacterium]
MSSKHAGMSEWPSVPADRDLPPGRHDLHRENLIRHIRSERGPEPGTSPAGPAGWRSRRRRLAAAVACAAVVAVVAGYAISARSAAPPPRRSTGKPAATLAAKVLGDAAAHVAREAATAEARPGQWIYSKTITVGFDGRYPSADDFWVTFDGSQNAYYSGGQLIVHTSDPNPPGTEVLPWTAWNEAVSGMTACNVLRSLPARPQQLLTVIAAHMGTISDLGADSILIFSPAPATRAQAEFVYLTHIMWNTFLGAGCPPAALAPAYRALATLPGISVHTGITDAVGAPAIGISDDGGYSQLLLSPASYQVIGQRVISTGVDPLLQRLQERIGKLPGSRRAAALKRLRALVRARGNVSWPAKGAVVSSTALVRVAEVAAPGDV